MNGRRLKSRKNDKRGEGETKNERRSTNELKMKKALREQYD